MNELSFSFAGHDLRALGTGALWWPEESLLCVSDLHLGKAERIARRGGASLPPYDTLDTLVRLANDVEYTKATTVICLGDSFDDLDAASALGSREKLQIAALQAGRTWIWIEGNHDPGPVESGGSHLAEHKLRSLVFRHIALPDGQAEVSGHYHPKARFRLRGRTITRAAFLVDETRLLLPAYGTYTGGLYSSDEALKGLMSDRAMAILTGQSPQMIPMPR
ncbi:ligase-associated DNA damage response endonuclease PdeM [Ruegeria sp. HU-ET01832]|uniref:ligase-associated DNA damage response endonuclease PdeM n=1 Tax=Ruegeria sp. HU-ET01832 TaxID=3135906 RepID=UPI00310B95AA